MKLANQQVDLKAYKTHLYRHGIPENNDDFKYEGSIPLEYNLVFMNGGRLRVLDLKVLAFQPQRSAPIVACLYPYPYRTVSVPYCNRTVL